MNIIRNILSHAVRNPLKTAVKFYENEVVTDINYQQLMGSINCYANTYVRSGIKKGDLVLVFMKHHKDLYGAFFGAIAIGAIPAFMPCPSEKQDHMKYWQSHKQLFDLIQPKCIVSQNDTLLEMRNQGLFSSSLISIDINKDISKNNSDSLEIIDSDIAFLQHSSGTTGLKKGVMLSHKAVIAQIESYKQALNIGDNEVFASWLPVYHDMGLISCTVMPLVLGLTVCVIDPFEWVSKPWSLFEVIQSNKANFCWLPNFAFKHLVRTVKLSKKSFDLSSMKAFINCSEPCKKETFDEFYLEFEKFGVRREHLQVCYAMAETVFAVSQTNLLHPAKCICVNRKQLELTKQVSIDAAGGDILSVGRVIDGLDVVVFDDEFHPLDENFVGQIAIRGDFIFDGYYKRDNLTQERFYEGWYLTRDNGFFRDGELYVIGRADDLMIIHGRNYYAHEVELHLTKVSGVRPGRAVAFAIYNKISESEEAYVIAEVDEGLEQSQDLKKQIKQVVFDEMGLDLFHVGLREVNWLVKTTSGKISRSDNKEKFILEV
ncbi:MAG: AMP-binding protein [Burkholderiales bacterium]|nr:AMP-binding protein [Burkholderiales bacterium]